MDPRLAELYGTNQVDAEDLEKAAAAEFAEGLTEEGALSLDGIDGEELEALAQEVLAGGEEQGEEVSEEETSEEEVEKLAEADFLGRAMAHAYVAELREIEKSAESLGDEVGKAEKKKAVSRQSESTGGGKGAVSARKIQVKSKLRLHAESGAKKVKEKGLAAFKKLKGHAGAAGAHIKKYPGRYGAGAAGAAALGGGLAYAKSKQASAFETLAEQRAAEILEQNGVEAVEASEAAEQTKYDVLASAVEQRAVEMLSAQGYEIE
jgi:hypothetical protein